MSFLAISKDEARAVAARGVPFVKKTLGGGPRPRPCAPVRPKPLPPCVSRPRAEWSDWEEFFNDVAIEVDASLGAVGERVVLLRAFFLLFAADFFRSFFVCFVEVDGVSPTPERASPLEPVPALDPVEFLVIMVIAGAVRLRRKGTRLTYVGFLPRWRLVVYLGSIKYY